MSKYLIKGLAYAGGVVRGVAYPGFLRAIEKNGLRRGVEFITGSSTGSIMAMMTALGARADHLEDIVLNKDGKGLDIIKIFMPGKVGQSSLIGVLESPWSVVAHGGLSDGHNLSEFLAVQSAIICPDYKIKTFADLYEHRAYELKIYGSSMLLNLYIPVTNLNTSSKEVFSYETTPDLRIVDAVRMSTALPGAFTPVRYGKYLYADASIIDSFPINEFDYERFSNPNSTHPYRPIYNYQTLGCCFANATKIEALKAGMNPPAIYEDITNDFILAEAVALATKNASYVNLSRELGRTVLIDHLGISSVNIGMDQGNKKRLIKSAEDATNELITGKRREFGLQPQCADLAEYKNSNSESRINIGGINTSLPVARSSSFAEQVNVEKAKKKEQGSTCCIL